MISQKEYPKLNPLLKNIIGKIWIFHLQVKTGKKFELNNEVALNILYVPHGNKKM